MSLSEPWGREGTAAPLAHLLEALQERFEGVQGLALTAHHALIVSRQVHHRMVLRGLSHLDDYLALIDDAAEERTLLRDALLIGSTWFFRDEAVFAALARGLLDGVGRAHGGPFKIWVPGCSTGEEAYSLAMVLNERLEARGDRRALRVFATDLRESSVRHGRRGVYSLRRCEGISAARRARFFEPAEGGLRVVKQLREQIVWGRHDLARDPPFPAVDLVSCRNVLLYFERAAQGSILAKLHYALRPGGCLLLGGTESTRSAPDLFEPLLPVLRLYARRTPRPWLGRGTP